MDLRIFTEPQQGATYDDLLAVARRAEDTGFDAFFRSDHYLAMGVDGRPGPTDAWLTLAGLARETSTIRLGTLMTSATFRLPGPLAISVAQVDQMSGGRVELGIGAGWYEAEHTAYAIPFPSTRERFDRFEESLAVVTGLWGTPEGETFDFAGEHFTVADSPALPKPVQRPGPPVIIGGKGKRRTPALAARYAAEFNVPVRVGGHLARAVRPGPGGLLGRRARRPTWCCRTRWCCASAATSRSWPGGPPRSAATSPTCGRTAWPAPRRRSSTGSGRTPTPARRAPTCRCSTSPTSTTSTWWPSEVMPHV